LYISSVTLRKERKCAGSWHSTTELLPLAFVFNDFQNQFSF
jgi:hypothetical protein